MPNRKRNKAVTLRMTADELSLFKRQFKKSNMKSQTDFILRLLKETPISVNAELVPVLSELQRNRFFLIKIKNLLKENKLSDDELHQTIQNCERSYSALIEKYEE